MISLRFDAGSLALLKTSASNSRRSRKAQPSTSEKARSFEASQAPGSSSQLRRDVGIVNIGVMGRCGKFTVLVLPPRTLVFDDAQVEAWHEDHPEEVIELGGAFSSRGPFTLTNSNLTASWFCGTVYT